MSSSEDYTFVCSECGQSISVNEAMREALVENGCAVCGSPVSETDFEAKTDFEAEAASDS